MLGAIIDPDYGFRAKNPDAIIHFIIIEGIQHVASIVVSFA